ncbi:hypothetical protein BC826DRAFT_972769 [Russula brevipes]|nr:hypothetical protein BC826DRAFT_972769 [Russula brevipes]
MMGQLYLSHASGTKGLEEGIVFENTISCVLLGISPVFGMPWCCGMWLFPIVSWAFRRGTGTGVYGWGTRDMGRGFGTVPQGMGAVVEAVFGIEEQWSLELARGVGWKEGGKEAPPPCLQAGPHHHLVAWSEARRVLIYPCVWTLEALVLWHAVVPHSVMGVQKRYRNTRECTAGHKGRGFRTILRGMGAVVEAMFEGAVVPGGRQGVWEWKRGTEAPPPCLHAGPHHRLVAQSKARRLLIYVDVGAYLGYLYDLG